MLCLSEGIVGNAQTTLVGDVLTQCQVAIGMEILDDDNLVELSSQFLGGCLETCGIALGPPVNHVALAVEHAALVVKAVRHFVADYHANGTIVGCIVGIHIEERWLQDGSREADLVGGGVVVGIHRLRRHAPLVLVNGLAMLVQVAASLVDCRSLDVLIERLLRIDLQATVVAPLVGITNLDCERVEFDQCVNLGRVAHPGQASDVCSQRLAQVGDQAHHLLLAVLGKVLLDIQFAHSLA